MTTKKTKPSTSTAAPAATTTTASTAAATTTSSGSAAFIQPPPAGANIPIVPLGTSITPTAALLGIAPTAAEEGALSAAVDDLTRFTNFATVFALAGIPYDQVVQCFTVSNQWTMMRNQTYAWDTYAQTQEAVCWGALRAMMKVLKPIFTLTAASNPSLVTTYPGLAALFGAKTAVAKKAVNTKRANKVALAAGLPASHGAVGKQRQTKAAKALLAASQGTTKSDASAAAVPIAPTPATPASATSPTSAH